jgi:hypothetical protein
MAMFEAIGEEGAHHESHLILARIAAGARLDIEAVRQDPGGKLRLAPFGV